MAKPAGKRKDRAAGQVGVPGAGAIMAEPTGTEQFLRWVRQSGVVGGDQLDACLQTLGGAEGLPTEPQLLAERLVSAGLLTDFQARQLLRARWQGFLIGGKYRVLELLGVGGMGRVLLCEHVRMRALVAVKVLPPDSLGEASTLDRFNREARAAANLVHPNLVRALDIDEDGELHYLVMEYVHGSSLQQVVGRNGPPSVARACDWVRQAALGLHHAHESGLVHRDIKPGNILLDWQGTIKVLDLGLARILRGTQDRLTAERGGGGGILGTVDYLAPEQAVDSQVGPLADVYSLGATFYFVLTGRAPFQDGSLAQKLIWHQMREPASVRGLRPEVPPEVEAVLVRMMAKEPGARYATPQEVALALAPWAAAPAPPPEADLPSWCPAVRRLLAAELPARPSAPAASTPPGLTLPPSAAVTQVAPSGARKAPRWRWRGLLLAGAAVLALAGVALPGLRLLFPPPRPFRQPSDLEGFNPFAGVNSKQGVRARLAMSLVGQTRTVYMTVRDRQRDGDNLFLYSENLKGGKEGKKAFTVLLDRNAQDKLSKAGVRDPFSYYQGRLIRVTGPIRYLTDGFDRPGIAVTDPEQIELGPGGGP
jgi:serine/threonine protein kinase